MKLLSFDIEIANIFDLKPGEPIENYAPFDISVIGTVVHGEEGRVWVSTDSDGKPLEKITPEKAREVLEYLQEKQAEGFMVCAWNGLKFDLRWLGHVAGERQLAADVALAIYDPMFQFFNQRGFLIGLDSVAKGMRLKEGKLMAAVDAPKQWAEGNHQAVMDYVLGDCRITNEAVLAIQEKKSIRWVTRKGTTSSEPMPRLMPVGEVIRTPGPPDQSWMDNPLPKHGFYAWAMR